MASALRVLCWNINEGRGGAGSTQKVDTELRRVAELIRSQSPDIVLLNEIREPNLIWWLGNVRARQARFLAQDMGLSYWQFGRTNRTGLPLIGTGWKGVAVLSRYPLSQARVVPVMREDRQTRFGTLVTSAMINGRPHYLLSTRFAPHNTEENRQENPIGIRQAMDLVKSLGPDSPILFGGDFNASTEPGTNEYEYAMTEFFDESTLKEAVTEGQPSVGRNRVDYLFYRGNYKVTTATFENPDPKASDHPWIFAVLEST